MVTAVKKQEYNQRFRAKMKANEQYRKRVNDLQRAARKRRAAAKTQVHDTIVRAALSHLESSKTCNPSSLSGGM